MLAAARARRHETGDEDAPPVPDHESEYWVPPDEEEPLADVAALDEPAFACEPRRLGSEPTPAAYDRPDG